jgi:hypothetical protein
MAVLESGVSALTRVPVTAAVWRRSVGGNIGFGPGGDLDRGAAHRAAILPRAPYPAMTKMGHSSKFLAIFAGAG